MGTCSGTGERGRRRRSAAVRGRRRLRPDGVGEERRRRGARRSPRHGGRLRGRDAGLPWPADPHQPARAADAPRCDPVARRGDERRGVRRRGARTEIDALVARARRRGGRRRDAASISVRRSPTSTCRPRWSRQRRERIQREVDADRAAAHARLAGLDPGCRRCRPRERPEASGARARACRGRALAGRQRSSLERRDAKTDVDRRARRPAPTCSSSASGSARRRCSPAASWKRFAPRSQRRFPAPPRRHSACERSSARARGGTGADRRPHPTLRRLSTQVDVADPRHRPRRRRSGRSRTSWTSCSRSSGGSLRRDALREVARARECLRARRTAGCGARSHPIVSRGSAIPAPGSGATACWRSPSATDPERRS